MNSKQQNLKESKLGVCRPGMSRRLYAYVAELLKDPAAEKFEDHMLGCPHCRREYLKLLGLRGGRDADAARRGDSAAEGDKVVSMNGFRRERS